MSENWRVRGIGVAVNVSVSTPTFSVLILSLTPTPNLCSSSTMSSPRSLNSTVLLTNLCVPIRMSIFPLLRFINVSRRCFECCAYSNFRFSKANITTNKTVHRHGAFHVFFHGFRRRNLVRCVFVQKAGLQFMLEVAVWRAFESNSLLAFCVQLDQIKSNLLHLRLRLLLERLPLWTTQFIQLGRSTVFSIELTDLMQ